ncbi:hypothetical protein GCM10010211_33340 [Streptomyces albospinus]|uniref:Methyltransferase type 11 domain-containing protein n=1 Tax=Streptomyces albospinus TaxID=285515 RepID=A0ABQ2V3V2_9ACTN|nr:hypothetical protein GCM10010211_33340 [Streptomyces albospinus]
MHGTSERIAVCARAHQAALRPLGRRARPAPRNHRRPREDRGASHRSAKGHWTDPAQALPEARRALRPGGTLALWWNIASHSAVLVRGPQSADAFLTEERARLTALFPNGTIEESYVVDLRVAIRWTPPHRRIVDGDDDLRGRQILWSALLHRTRRWSTTPARRRFLKSRERHACQHRREAQHPCRGEHFSQQQHECGRRRPDGSRGFRERRGEVVDAATGKPRPTTGSQRDGGGSATLETVGKQSRCQRLRMGVGRTNVERWLTRTRR